MSKRNQLLIGLAGSVGVGLAAWRSIFPWLGQDEIKFIKLFLNIGKETISAMKNNTLVIDVFEEKATKHPEYPFILFEDKSYSYGFVNEMANKVAGLAATWNLKRGDTVAMMMSNEPGFIWTFLGLQKLGLITAFINFNLRSSPLAHCVNSCDAKVLILGNGCEYLDAVDEIKNDLNQLLIYVQGKRSSELTGCYRSFDEGLLRAFPVPVCRSYRADISLHDTMCYIFTSGTTGLPKPAILNHLKGFVSMLFWSLFDFKHEDRVYIVTPLYHGVATNVALFNAIKIGYRKEIYGWLRRSARACIDFSPFCDEMLASKLFATARISPPPEPVIALAVFRAVTAAGATVVLKRKFSAREYFDDCRRYDVTVIQYIGELLRYLLHQPERTNDDVHKIRVAFGNGLRPDVWEKFQNRFKIPWIIEFFGASEGVGLVLNCSNRAGAIGKHSPLLAKVNGTQLVKYDRQLDDVVRDKNGRCIPIRPGEEGVIISQIPPNHSGFYKGPKELDDKKVIQNVFKEGDRYFNFGDLAYMDQDYFLYFRDRLGDTFRWRGENVSTTEVGNVLSGLEFIRDISVYGVQVPGHDGRAGMAAILFKEDKEVTSDMLSKLYEYCQHHLPSYARPLFIRVVKEITLTETMKHRKVEYVKEGFDPSVIQEPLYFLDSKKKTYSKLDSLSYNTVLSSKL